MIPITYNTVNADELILNENETKRRLQAEKDFNPELVEQCLKELRDSANCKFSAVLSQVSYYDDDFLDCGFGKFKSQMLTKSLSGAKTCFIFAVTLGLGVDRLLNKYSLSSPSKHFIYDALASSLAEALADKAEKIIKGDKICTPRFSPGYGDLPLEIQPNLLRFLNAGRLLGITINNSLLMSPGKSVTAIMGIKNE